MTKPGTEERLPMFVEHYCPYLYDSVGAVPSRLSKNTGMAALTPAVPGPPKVELDIDTPAVVEVPPAAAPHVDIDPDARRDVKAEATSTTHILRHMPYNKYCPTCVRAKMLRRPARRAVRNPGDAPNKFGDLVNADHIIASSDEAMGLTGERNAMAIVDRFTDNKDCFPLATKDADEAHGALLEYFGRLRPKYMWMDSTPELICAISDLKIPHGKATPSRHQNNGYCERVVRKIVEGARVILEHAGLPNCFWTFAVRY
jgi:hypothetical protein